MSLLYIALQGPSHVVLYCIPKGIAIQYNTGLVTRSFDICIRVVLPQQTLRLASEADLLLSKICQLYRCCITTEFVNFSEVL